MVSGFCLFFVQWDINIRRLVILKAIPAEELWLYNLTHSWCKRCFHAFCRTGLQKVK